MPRYYFNIYDGQEIFDDEGIVLAGPRDVRDRMMVLAQAWIEQETHWETHWHIEARDDDGNIVGSMRFGVKDEEEA